MRNLALRHLCPAVLLAGLLLAAPAPAPAAPLAAALTDGLSLSAAKKRPNAKPVDEDAPPPEDDAPPPRRAAESDEDAPRARRGSSDDEESSPARRGREDDEEEGAARASPRHHRTAEEEMGEESGEQAEERLAGEDEMGRGMNAGVLMGLVLFDGSKSGMEAKFGMGVNFDLNAGRYFFPPEDEFLHNGLHVEFSYLYSWWTDGTTGGGGVPANGQVQVKASFHELALAPLIGIPLPHVLLYGKIGPVLIIQPVNFAVEGVDTGFTGVKFGLIYGVGGRSEFFLSDKVGVTVGIELDGVRRSYLNDVLLLANVAFLF